MKTNFRIRHIILALLCCISLVASAMSYKVSSQNSLNVRSHPSTSANVVFKLQSGDIVEGVSEIDENGWIAISGRGFSGYVKANYLQPIEDEPNEQKQVMNDGSAFAIVVNTLLGGQGDGSRKIAYFILVEILVMWFICKFLRGLTLDFYDTRTIGEEWLKWVTPIIMIITSCTIFYYVKSLGTNSLWFLQPSIVNSWWFIILNFVIFFYAFTNLIVFFIKTIGDLGQCFWSSINIKLGMIGWTIGIVGFVISYFCKKEWLDYVLWFEFAIQGIQVIIIACSIKKNKLLGSTAIVLLALPLTVIAIVVAIGIMILCFLAKADTGNSCSSDSRSKGTLIDGPNGPFIQIDSGGSVNVVEVYGNMVRDQNNESWHLNGTSVVKM